MGNYPWHFADSQPGSIEQVSLMEGNMDKRPMGFYRIEVSGI
jgi:hypothetical protein